MLVPETKKSAFKWTVTIKKHFIVRLNKTFKLVPKGFNKSNLSKQVYIYVTVCLLTYNIAT